MDGRDVDEKGFPKTASRCTCCSELVFTAETGLWSLRVDYPDRDCPYHSVHGWDN